MSLLNLLFPPQCLICTALVPSHGTLCLACWQQVSFISAPFCDICGLPFDFDLGSGALCGECIQERPVYAKARTVFRYNEHSRALVTKLKYADQTYLAKIYAPWLAHQGKELIEQSELIIPVPLHYRRFISRRYNQAALLAYALHRLCNVPVLPDGLARIRATKPQPGLTRKQRQDNVKGAFRVHARYAERIKGKTVLLVDDVMTTSATIQQCTKALLKADARHVHVLTLARKTS